MLANFPQPLDAEDRELAAACCVAYLAGDQDEVARLTAKRLQRLSTTSPAAAADMLLREVTIARTA